MGNLLSFKGAGGNNDPRQVSATDPLPVTQAPAVAGSQATAFTEGTCTVAAAATPQALGTGKFAEVFIFPLRTNTGSAYFGTSATNDSQHGLLPAVITAPRGEVIDISLIYIDVTVNGEGVRWMGTL